MAAKLTHASLYLLLLAMPLTGIGSYYAGFDAAGSIHADVLKAVLWAVVGVHVMGALVHQFVRRTGRLRRMIVW